MVRVRIPELDIDQKFDFKRWGTAEAAKNAALSYVNDLSAERSRFDGLKKCDLVVEAKANGISAKGNKAEIISALMDRVHIPVPEPLVLQVDDADAMPLEGRNITGNFMSAQPIPTDVDEPPDPHASEPNASNADIWMAGYIINQVAKSSKSLSQGIIEVGFLLGRSQDVRKSKSITMIDVLFQCASTQGEDSNGIMWPTVSDHLREFLSKRDDLDIVGWIRRDPHCAGITEADKNFQNETQKVLPKACGMLLDKEFEIKAFRLAEIEGHTPQADRDVCNVDIHIVRRGMRAKGYHLSDAEVDRDPVRSTDIALNRLTGIDNCRKFPEADVDSGSHDSQLKPIHVREAVPIEDEDGETVNEKVISRAGRILSEHGGSMPMRSLIIRLIRLGVAGLTFDFLDASFDVESDKARTVRIKETELPENQARDDNAPVGRVLPLGPLPFALLHEIMQESVEIRERVTAMMATGASSSVIEQVVRDMVGSQPGTRQDVALVPLALAPQGLRATKRRPSAEEMRMRRQERAEKHMMKVFFPPEKGASGRAKKARKALPMRVPSCQPRAPTALSRPRSGRIARVNKALLLLVPLCQLRPPTSQTKSLCKRIPPPPALQMEVGSLTVAIIFRLQMEAPSIAMVRLWRP